MKSKCWECEKEINVNPKEEWVKIIHTYKIGKPSPNHLYRRFYCEKCEEETKEQRRVDKLEYTRLNKKLMFERAVVMLEKQQIDFMEYHEAIKAVEDYSKNNLDKFDSSHEMVACIILIKNRVHTKPNYRICGYIVDFLILEHKIILEIDGERHDGNGMKDNNRDIKLRTQLGPEWEVVRISTKYMEENAQLLIKGMIELKKLKQHTRKLNGGILPKNFSKRDIAKVQEIEEIMKK